MAHDNSTFLFAIQDRPTELFKQLSKWARYGAFLTLFTYLAATYGLTTLMLSISFISFYVACAFTLVALICAGIHYSVGVKNSDGKIQVLGSLFSKSAIFLLIPALGCVLASGLKAYRLTNLMLSISIPGCGVACALALLCTAIDYRGGGKNSDGKFKTLSKGAAYSAIFLLIPALGYILASGLKAHGFMPLLGWVGATIQWLSAPLMLSISLTGVYIACALTLVALVCAAIDNQVPSQKSVFAWSKYLLTFAGLSVAIFTAGGFVTPVSMFLGHLNISPYLARLLTPIVFVITIPAWYNLYCGGAGGMTAWFRKQFFSAPERRVQRAVAKMLSNFEHDWTMNDADSSPANKHTSRAEYLKASCTLWLIKKALNFSNKGTFTDSQVDKMQAYCLEINRLLAIITTNQGGDEPLFEFKVDDSRRGTLYHPQIRTASTEIANKNDDASSEMINQLYKVLLKITNTKKGADEADEQWQARQAQTSTGKWMERTKLKIWRESNSFLTRYMSRLGRAWGALNAFIANSTSNMYGAACIALSFPILHIATAPLVLKVTFVAWAGIVGYLAAASLTTAAIVTRLKGLTKWWGAYRPQTTKQASWLHTILTSMNIICAIITSICLSCFNFKSARLVFSKSMVLFYGGAQMAITPLATAFGVVAFVLTLLAAGSFFLYFSLSLIDYEKNIYDVLKDYFKSFASLKAWKEKGFASLITLLGTCATTCMIIDGVVDPTGPIAPLVGVSTALTMMMSLIVAYLVYFMYKSGAENITLYNFITLAWLNSPWKQAKCSEPLQTIIGASSAPTKSSYFISTLAATPPATIPAERSVDLQTIIPTAAEKQSAKLSATPVQVPMCFATETCQSLINETAPKITSP